MNVRMNIFVVWNYSVFRAVVRENSLQSVCNITVYSLFQNSTFHVAADKCQQQLMKQKEIHECTNTTKINHLAPLLVTE